MLKVLKVIGLVVGIIVLSIVTLLVVARFADGPWGPISGGSFSSGDAMEKPASWDFLKDRQEVEFELEATGRSRTSWVAVVDGRVFIPSGYMNTPMGKLWKHWPFDAVEDGRAILRVDNQLYKVNMIRHMDDPALPGVLAELRRKYFPNVEGEVPMGEVESGNTWVFELVHR